MRIYYYNEKVPSIHYKHCIFTFIHNLLLLYIFLFLGTVSISKYFPSIEENHAEKKLVYRESLVVDIDDLVKGLCPGVQMDVYHIGFPSLHLIPITVC